MGMAKRLRVIPRLGEILLSLALFSACSPSEESILKAAESGKVEQVRHLLDRGANPNARTGDDCAIPLHIAAAQSSPEICRTLLQAGAQVDAKDSENVTPLDYAILSAPCSTKLPEIVDLFLENGANVTERAKDRTTPLHFAVANGCILVVEPLLARGARIDVISKKGAPLHLAAFWGDSNKIRFLCERGANPNVSNQDGATPLPVASENGEWGSVRTLLEEGAGPNIKNKEGKTPREVAAPIVQGSFRWPDQNETHEPDNERLSQ